MTHNTSEAHFVAGRLRSERIPTQILTYAGGAALGIIEGVLGEVRLLVLAEEVKRARTILESDTPKLPTDSARITITVAEDAS